MASVVLSGITTLHISWSEKFAIQPFDAKQLIDRLIQCVALWRNPGVIQLVPDEIISFLTN